MTQEEKFLLAKKVLLSFKDYVLWIHKLAQGSDYDMTDGHIKVCDMLQKHAEGKLSKRNLMINVSPGFGKSLLLQYYITWCFARSKHCMFCYVAYGEKLIKKLSRESRNLMMMPEWEELFGKEMDPSDKSVLNYHLISGGVRSGLTAGTVSSAMLGLDAGNPSSPDGGFSGDLLCFPYSAKVLTSKGERKIGDIVKNKESVDIACSGGWGKVVDWQENPGSEILEVVYEHGSLKCTPDHKIYTNKGWKRADELSKGDIIIGADRSPSSPYSFNDINAKAILDDSRLNWHRLDVSDNVLRDSDEFFSVYSSDGRKLSTSNNIIEESSTDTKKLSFGRSYFANLYLGQRGVGQRKVFNGIRHIFLTCAIFQIIKSIIGGVIVNMTNIVTNRTSSNKCGRDSNVNKQAPTHSIDSRTTTKVTDSPLVWSSRSFNKMLSHYLFRHLVTAHTITDGVLLGIRVRPTFDSPEIGGEIVGIIGDWFPNFTVKKKSGVLFNACCNFAHSRVLSVNKCNSTDKTYCLTVKKYHTFLAKSSGSFMPICSNCDDINSPEVINSVHEQVETPEIYQRKLATRRRTPQTGTICIMQRHHPNDFAGWVLKNEPEEWEVITIPAIDELGNSFYPKRYPIEELRRLEKQNPYMFAAMYQQHPVENYGAYFHEEWIRTYRATPEKFSKVFITTDFGFTISGDKSLFCCWGLANDNNLYLLRSRVGKWESPDAKKQCVDFFNHCRAAFPQCRRVYIEKTLSGIGFIQDMRRERPEMAIVPLARGAKKNKMNRVESAMTWMEAGRVYFREADPNYVGARAELLAYNPNDKNPKDEWCFVAGTKIMTAWGEKNIEDIKVGDKLWTPIGYTKVLKTGNRKKEVITNLGLTGTPDHKIWNPLHFRFDNLGDVCYFEPRLIQRSVRWKILKLYLMINGISLTKRQDIIYSTTKTMQKETGKRFTGLFGNIIQERRYLRAMLFIILTGIGVTTTILTLCAFRLLNTVKSTGGAIKHGNGLKRILKGCKILLKKHALGIRVQKEEQKVLRCQEKIWTKLKKLELACCAGNNSITSLRSGRTIEKSAITAKTAGNTKQNAVVYSIKTGNGVYVANSVLVSNCDNIGDAAEIAFNNKVGSIFI